mmetsp:Transcript_27804/g.45900  ORF Transcript_27804/g.45900 Transcript_27804/m.45900 type:complete len:89 (+) Transcript_27804:421-687(+)
MMVLDGRRCLLVPGGETTLLLLTMMTEGVRHARRRPTEMPVAMYAINDWQRSASGGNSAVSFPLVPCEFTAYKSSPDMINRKCTSVLY